MATSILGVLIGISLARDSKTQNCKDGEKRGTHWTICSGEVTSLVQGTRERTGRKGVDDTHVLFIRAVRAHAQAA